MSTRLTLEIASNSLASALAAQAGGADRIGQLADHLGAGFRWYPGEARDQAQARDWGDAIRAWNGGSPRTRDELVCRIQAKLQVTNPASRLLASEQCGARFAQDRRNGAALLEVAEAKER